MDGSLPLPGAELQDLALTTIKILVGFFTLFAALSLSYAVRASFENSPTLEREGPWLTAFVAVGTMLVMSVVLTSVANRIRKTKV